MIDGEVLDVGPPRLLRCRWTIEGVPTTVTVRLHADGDGTVLHLEHVRLTPEGCGPISTADGVRSWVPT